MKQTAVEFFEYELKDKLGTIVINKNWELLEQIIEQAKEMEKQQIIEVAMYHRDSSVKRECIESYINKTFKSE